jgi:hypothetical protein
MAIAGGWSDLRNYNDTSICAVNRYLAAGGDVADYPLFNAWWMIRNWHTDFLAQQPPCSTQPKTAAPSEPQPDPKAEPGE